MKSMAELASEPRLMQFIVERGCPELPQSEPTRVTLPIVVWVDLGKQANPNSQNSCSAKQYVVPYSQAEAIRRADGKTTNGDCRVCEHMGRIIE